MSGKHKLAWSEGQQLRLIHAGSLEIYFDKCYRNMEGEPVLKKASITQTQIGIHWEDYVFLFRDCFDILRVNSTTKPAIARQPDNKK